MISARILPFASDPALLAERLRPDAQTTFVYLDSNGDLNADNRWAMIGRGLWFDSRVINGKTIVNGQPTQQSLWAVARQFLRDHGEDCLGLQNLDPELPFRGGLIGCLGYDFAVLESAGLVPLPPVHHSEGPQAWLQAFDQMAIIDREKQCVFLLAWGKLQPSDVALAELENVVLLLSSPALAIGADLIQLHQQLVAPPDWADQLVQSSNFTPSAYQDCIRQVIQAIGAGEVYILNLTQRFVLPGLKAPWLAYRSLRQVSPTAYAVYFQQGQQHLLSFSPEQFLKIRNRTVITRPIKGTRPRGSTSLEDEQLRQALLASEKDRAELLMIVDLERNDLSRVCEPASVQVRELFKLETYATVFHLVASIEGQLAAGEDALSCLKACFPGGSITGAPKIRAMQLISQFEGLGRGLYTGCFGYLSLDGQADFNILIRTIFATGDQTLYQAGGGITWDSDPESEYQETLDKAWAIGGLFDADL